MVGLLVGWFGYFVGVLDFIFVIAVSFFVCLFRFAHKTSDNHHNINVLLNTTIENVLPD